MFCVLEEGKQEMTGEDILVWKSIEVTQGYSVICDM